jgi:RHS repeat-associated protein
MATANPFRFSTKFQDDETGLLYYGYRYYDPSTGRWNSNDPFAEKGGRNLCAFIANQPISWVDINGLYRFMGLDYIYGTASGAIGPEKRAFVRWRSGILKLEIDEEMLDCGLCCLKNIEFYLKLTVYLPVVGDVLAKTLPPNYPGGEIKATATDVANLAAHEAVHVQHGQAVGSAIFPDIESKCKGKCWRRPLGGLWSRNECYRFLFAKMSAYDEKVTQWNGYGPGGLSTAWDSIFIANSDGYQWNFQVPTTDAMRSDFQVIQAKKIGGWLKEPWCSDGF